MCIRDRIKDMLSSLALAKKQSKTELKPRILSPEFETEEGGEEEVKLKRGGSMMRPQSGILQGTRSGQLRRNISENHYDVLSKMDDLLEKELNHFQQREALSTATTRPASSSYFQSTHSGPVYRVFSAHKLSKVKQLP
eukprot:TRINITY_DN14694_c0_g1_i1.p1 TRINITY_DN14694_c0_g1~~TRINITY_DN14694_c0_g1_i1.p1  ORF type:complete len:158 (-),score=35.70 TRINITY_DN14694_c0_g1_i1:83-496(-)